MNNKINISNTNFIRNLKRQGGLQDHGRGYLLQTRNLKKVKEEKKRNGWKEGRDERKKKKRKEEFMLRYLAARLSLSIYAGVYECSSEFCFFFPCLRSSTSSLTFFSTFQQKLRHLPSLIRNPQISTIISPPHIS